VNFVSLAIANLFSETTGTRLAKEIEKVKNTGFKNIFARNCSFVGRNEN